MSKIPIRHELGRYPARELGQTGPGHHLISSWSGPDPKFYKKNYKIYIILNNYIYLAKLLHIFKILNI